MHDLRVKAKIHDEMKTVKEMCEKFCLLEEKIKQNPEYTYICRQHIKEEVIH